MSEQILLPEEAPLFSSQVHYTPSLHQDFQTGYRLSGLLQIVLSIWIIIASFLYWLLLPDTRLAVLYLVIGGILLATRVPLFLPRKKGSFSYKQMLYTQGGKEPRQLVRFYRDRVFCTNLQSGTHASYAYTEVTRLIETKHLLLLVLKFKLALVVDKDTLEGGSARELKAHLLRRCPNMKKKVRSDKPGRAVTAAVILVIILTMALCLFSLLPR